MTDKQLDRLYRRWRTTGDLTALGEAFDLAAPELYRVARHLARTEAEAEDAVQTTFLVAVEKPEQYDPRRPFITWMLGILANRCKEQRRRDAREPEVDRLVEREAEDPSRTAADREFASVVEERVRELPENYAGVLRAYLADGQGPSEIANRLGLSANAVSVRIHRGLSLLRKALPASFALGAAALATSSSSLASMRTTVLARAAKTSALTPLTGGLLMSKKLHALVVTCIFLLGGFWLYDELYAASDPEAVETIEVPLAVADLPEITEALVGIEPGEAERAEVAAVTPGSSGELKDYYVRVVDHETSRPIAGARARDGRAKTDEELGVTGEKGTLEFRAARDVAEFLFVEAPGYAPFRMPLSESGRDEVKREILFKEEADRISFVDIRLKRGAHVFGHVTDAETRAPISGARIYVFEGEYSGPIAVTDHLLATSDGAGRFAIEGRVAWVTRQQKNYVVFAVTDGALGWADVPVLDGHEEVEGVEIEVNPALPLVVHVKDVEGQPVEGVRVHCVPRSLPWIRLSGMPAKTVATGPVPAEFLAIFEQRTDEKGTARFPNLPASAGEGAQARTEDGWFPYVEFAVFFDAPGWDIPPQTKGMVWGTDSAVLDVVAKTRREITLSGELVDADGRPVAGADVRVGKRDSFDTDEGGRFEVARVLADEFPLHIRTSPRDLPPMSVEVALPEEGDTARVRIVHERPVGIAGIVVDESGFPVSGVRVRGRQDDLELTGTPPTNERGEFAFPEAGAGEWSLTAFAYSPYRELGEGVAKGGEKDVKLIVASEAEIPTGRLIARVIDGESGEALDASSARLVAIDETSSSVPTPEVHREAGRVTVDQLPAGKWLLVVDVADRATARQSFELENHGEDVQLEVSVHRRVDLVGTIDFTGVDRPKLPWVLATLDAEALAPGASKFFSGRSLILWVDEEDHFRVGGLEPGPWTFVVAGEGVYSEKLAVDVRSDMESPVLRARTAGKLTLLGDVPLDGVHPMFEIRKAGGEWELPSTSFERSPDLKLWASIPPGEIEWRLRFPRSGISSTPNFAAEEITGEVEIVAGDELVVPFSARLLD